MLRNIKTIIFVLILVLMQITPVFANDVREVYDLYQIPYVLNMDKDALEKINKHNAAEHYLAQYKNLTKLEYDRDSIDSKMLEMRKELTLLKEQLIAGYYKSNADLYKMEEDFNTTLHRLQLLEQRKKTNNVHINSFNIDGVPSKEEYAEALRLRDEALKRTNIGNSVSMNFPLKSAAVVITNDDNILTIKGLPNTSVVSCYDGVITEKTYDKMLIASDDVIEIGYSNITSELQVGDVVTAGQKIGVTENGYLSMQLKIEDVVYDISKLFNEG